MDKTRQLSLTDGGHERKYFTILPNILWIKGLTLSAFKLYATIKKVAGPSGTCYMSTRRLAKEADISVGATSGSKQLLKELGLITIKARRRTAKGQPIDHISTTDIWEENILYFSKCSRESSLNEPEEEPLEEEQKKNQECSLNEHPPQDPLEHVLELKAKKQKRELPITYLSELVATQLGLAKVPNYEFEDKWEKPLRDLLDQADGDIDKVEQALKTAMRRGREANLTLSTPHSLHNLALQALATPDADLPTAGLPAAEIPPEYAEYAAPPKELLE